MGVYSSYTTNKSVMDKTQRDLLAACWNKKMKAEYSIVQEYAARFKKYDNLRISQIDEVVEKLKELIKN